jgi:hypothetical protein
MRLFNVEESDSRRGVSPQGEIMKRLLLASGLLCLSVCAAQAQEGISAALPQASNVAANFSATTVPLVRPFPAVQPIFTASAFELASPIAAASNASVTTALALPMGDANAATPDPAAPAPNPKFILGDRDDYRWQLGIGVSFERFRSNIYSASAVGTNTDLTYYLNDWLGVEGNASTFFAPAIWFNEHIKLLNYGAGPKISWRRPRWEPWFHGLFGGTHALPQTAGHSQDGLSVQIGGGADYRLAPRLSLRLELDYVGTHLFGAWQNNGQGAAGIVFHF